MLSVKLNGLRSYANMKSSGCKLAAIFISPRITRSIGRSAITVALWGFSTSALATMPKATDSLSFVPALASLVVVIIAIFALAFVAKRFNLGISGNRAIKVVSALSLGTRERVVVIEVAGKQHLLGVTAQQVNHLFELEQPLDESAAEPTPFAKQDPMTFQKLLQGFKNQKGSKE